MAAQTPKPKRRRERDDDGIHWDKVNKCYQGTISLGFSYGTVRVAGLTIEQAEVVIRNHLSKVLKDPKVSVALCVPINPFPFSIAVSKACLPARLIGGSLSVPRVVKSPVV